MKKSFIAFATLHAVAALAHAESRSPSEAGPIVLKPDRLGEQTNEMKLNVVGDETAAYHETIVSQELGNDEMFKPIVTREMLAGTQPRLKPGALRRPQGDSMKRAPFAGLRLQKQQIDLNPVSIIGTGGGSQCREGVGICIVPQVTTSRMAAAAHA